MSILSFRNYESLKLPPENYNNVGWRFFIASIFYLILFVCFLNINTNKSKDEVKEVKIENENDIDKSEPFIEGRI